MSEGSTLLTEPAQPVAAPPPAPAGNPPVASQPDPHVTPPGGPEWHLTLPEDLRGHPSLSKFQTVEGLAKSYVNAEKLIGGDKVPIPKDENDKESWDRFYQAAGRPDSADKYEFKRPENLPPELPYDETREKYFRDLVHQNGLSQRQANALYDAYIKTEMERHGEWQKSSVAKREEATRALQREWGGAYDANVTAAKVALQQFATPEYIAYLDQSGEGNNPAVLKQWQAVGKQLIGDQRLQGGDGGPSSPADLQSAIVEFRSKHNVALMDKHHIEHDLRVKELNALFNRAYPEQNR